MSAEATQRAGETSGVATQAMAVVVDPYSYPASAAPLQPQSPSPAYGPISAQLRGSLSPICPGTEALFAYSVRIGRRNEFLETTVWLILWLCGLASIAYALYEFWCPG